MAARLLAVLVLLTLAAGSALAAPLRIAVISDLNGSYGSVEYQPRVAEAVAAIIALRPDLVISAGDMVAGQRRPALGEAEVRAMWRAFHREVSDPLAAAGIPLAVTPGNHDASAYPGFEAERRIFAEEWRDRPPAVDWIDARAYPFHYAFVLDGVVFAGLDATRVGRLDPGQTRWLPGVMAGPARARVVFSHLPMWPIAQGRETQITQDPALAALFADLGVDLHLAGHHHAFYPGAARGTAFVSVACLGSGPRRLVGASETSDPGFVLLEIDEAGTITVAGRHGPGFRETVDLATLPPRMAGAAGALVRLDRAELPNVRAAR